MSVSTARPQARRNVTSNATITILGTEHFVPQQRTLSNVKICPKTRSGTMLKAMSRLGTAKSGIRLIQLQNTTKNRVQQNAALSAKNTTLGMAANASPILRPQTAIQNLRTQSGTMKAQTVSLFRPGAVKHGCRRHMRRHSAKLQANAYSNAPQDMSGTKSNASQHRPRQQTAQVFRQMQNGTLYPVSLKLGTETTGFPPISEYTIQIRVSRNAASNAMSTTLGTVKNVLLTQKSRTVPVCQKMQAGIPYRKFQEHGTVLHGFLLRKALTTKLRAQRSAASSATKTTVGMVQTAIRIQKFRNAQDYPTMQAGTRQQALPKLGMDLHGNHQQMASIAKRQAKLNATTNAVKIISGTVQNV